MQRRHVIHLLDRYIDGQLRPAQRARVVNHVRVCVDCRAALAREERLAADVKRELPALSMPRNTQLANVWAGVMHEITATKNARTRLAGIWLSGSGVLLAVVVLLAVAVPLLASDGRADAAPRQPRPISTASPTPGATDTLLARQAQVGGASTLVARALQLEDESDSLVFPQSTVAFVAGPNMGATPAPMPGMTVSPVVP